MEPDTQSRSPTPLHPTIARPSSRVPRSRRRRSPSNDNQNIIVDRTGRDDVSHRAHSTTSDINHGRFVGNPGFDVQTSAAPVVPEVYLHGLRRSQEDHTSTMNFPSPRPPVADVHHIPVDRSHSLRPSIPPDQQLHSFRSPTPPAPIARPTIPRTHRRHRSPSNDNRHIVDNRTGRDDPSRPIHSNAFDINHQDRNAGIGVEASMPTVTPEVHPPIASRYPLYIHLSPSQDALPDHMPQSFRPSPIQPSPTYYPRPIESHSPPAPVIDFDPPRHQLPPFPSPQPVFPVAHEYIVPPIQFHQPQMMITESVFDSIPHQVYSTVGFLQIPTFYQMRVFRAFEDVGMSVPEIRGAMLDITQQKLEGDNPDKTRPRRPSSKSDAKKFKKLLEAWKEFVETVVKEWETFNIISALLLSAILSILQMDVAVIPIIRYPALISLFCAFISLTFGSIYVSKFSEMKRASVAAEFALETKQSSCPILFNAWIMLAMPASWLAWSMILFLVSITSLIWTTGATDNSTNTLSSYKSFVPRLITSLVLLLGILYFVVIMITFSRYGGNLDKAWVRRLQETHRWDESLPKPRPPLDQGLSGWRKALVRH